MSLGNHDFYRGQRISQDARNGPQQEWEIARMKQINTLRIFNENVSEITNNQQYRVDFEAVNRLRLSMIISLSPGFPKERPGIQIQPTGLRHPWLDPGSGAVIGAPGLINYSVHSDLGRVVQAIKRELETKPPQVVVSTPNSNSGVGAAKPSTNSSGFYPSVQQISGRANVSASPSQPPGSNTSSSSTSGHSSAAKAAPVTAVKSSLLPGLASMSIKDLQELKDDPSALKLFSRSLDNPSMKRVSKDIATTRKIIQETMASNAELRAQVEVRRESLHTQTNEAHSLRDSLVKVASDVGEMTSSSKGSVRDICDRLQAACLEEEEESDSIAESFLNGDLPLDQFLSKYTQVRSGHHAKKAKLEKLKVMHQPRRMT